MAWVAVDEDGSEAIFQEKPIEINGRWYDKSGFVAELKEGSIRRILGYELEPNDDPVQINI